uniref:Con-Ins M1 n=1 Tax=Conus marmoreus TaxID=42752 RepID=INS1_CONMR|nr:RecName: Full=Con-Ins M1; AltName: Full=Insulin 1; Contains: RecName: Full=Con-Ins M1 B chain; Contains: RecName: Full=Con-Ins M1 A chain; Flags: Precursor [Conus marmoreus]AJD85835.1 insulin 1 precursor [Conus marmoreus]
MTTSSYFLLVALGLLLYVCQSSFGGEHVCGSNQPNHPNGKCGSKMADYLEEQCEEEEAAHGGTNDARATTGRALSLSKRRGFLSMLKRRGKRNEASPLQRAGRGIVCECCKNHCTDEEFTEYCPHVTESG